MNRDQNELFKLQDKIDDLLYKAAKDGVDVDDLAAMVVTTGDTFGRLNGVHWDKDRIELYTYFLDEAEDDENNIFI